MIYAKLWKRILNEGVHIPPDVLPEGSIGAVAPTIMTAPIIVDHVIQPMGSYDFDWSRYVRLTVPFRTFWVEGALGDQGSRWGALVLADRKGEKGWRITLMGVSGDSVSRPTMGLRSQIWLDEEGTLRDAKKGNGVLEFKLVTTSLMRPIAPQGMEMSADQLRIEVGKTCVQTVCDVLLTLSCRNVFLDPRQEDRKEVEKPLKRHGGDPTKYRYHVLVVRPPGARSDSPSEDLGVMPRHLCRGHHAEYGPEFGKGLLFGKHAGRFYIPPHMKGDRKNGVVEKDYAIGDV